MRPLVTVIVPVYNVKKYLDECVNSICAQTYRELEIILVDDGSTDGSGEMCDSYQDERIIVIHKQNAGVSAARNDGIDRASGEYLLFVDSDDFVAEDMVECMVKAALEENADCVIAKDMQVEEDGTRLVVDLVDMKHRLSGKEVMEMVCIGKIGYIWGMAASKLYKTETVADIRFPVGKRHEDEFFATRIFMKSEVVICIRRPLYFYRQHDGSDMHRPSITRFDAVESYFDRAELMIAEGMNAAAANWTVRGLRILWNYYRQCDWKFDAAHKKRVKELQTWLRRLEPKLIPYAKKNERFKLKIFSLNMILAAYVMGHNIARKKRKRAAREKERLEAAAIEAKRQKQMLGETEDFTIISNNCIGGAYIHDMGRRFDTPTVNLFFQYGDFLKFVNNIQYYLSLQPVFLREIEYPVGVLDDIKVYFRNFTSEEEARDCWDRRKARVIYDRIVVLCDDNGGMTAEEFDEWKKVKYPKVFFTSNKIYAENQSAVYYPEYAPGVKFDLIPEKKYLKDAAVTNAILSLDN